MDLVWIVYLIEVLSPALKLHGVAFLIMGVIGAILFFISWGVAETSTNTKAEERELFSTFRDNIVKWYVKPLACVLIPWYLVGKFIPAEDTAYKMLAAYGATELVQMEQTQELGGKAFDVVNKILDDYLVEDKQEE